MSEKWIPKVGDHVFSVCEFFLGIDERNKKIPGYDYYGYEIVESVVIPPYPSRKGWKEVESVSMERLLGNNMNSCFYWKPKDFGTRVFRTFEEAIPLAEEMTQCCKKHYMFGCKRPLYRHWIEQQGT